MLNYLSHLLSRKADCNTISVGSSDADLLVPCMKTTIRQDAGLKFDVRPSKLLLYLVFNNKIV